LLGRQNDVDAELLYLFAQMSYRFGKLGVILLLLLQALTQFVELLRYFLVEHHPRHNQRH